MSIKTITKLIIPSIILDWIRECRYNKLSKIYYSYDSQRFNKYSNAFVNWDNSEKLIGQIVAEYHVIEKGLAMPNMRFGFGKAIMNDLINHCILYSKQYDKSHEQFLYTLRVIAEYKFVHLKNNYILDNDLLASIDSLLSDFEVNPSEQIAQTREEYLKYTNDSFINFSNSRHSLRNFTGSIQIETISEAVQLAQNTPSACNRQPSRVYVVQDKIQMEAVLKIQSGNRGFGHLADKIIVLTAELGGFLGLNERNDAFVNGGMYAMNLLYALHYFHIGACSLNWCSTIKQDQELRIICGINPSETIIMIIACGGIPNSFKLVSSHRNDYKSILKIV